MAGVSFLGRPLFKTWQTSSVSYKIESLWYHLALKSLVHQPFEKLVEVPFEMSVKVCNSGCKPHHILAIKAIFSHYSLGQTALVNVQCYREL